MEQTAQVLRLWDQRVPTTTIATRTGVHRDTVTNIVRAAESLMAGADRMRA
ncbi:helix-turn-helix domain-containing protein [Candidatus Mycobacterium methanotrophicum]|uniref:Helix-turn-helix domain-containing protein n=1 Tax=Candidatus Mycobacterium methanotrophicum TaxID=2943498 RepID=A0ABY4QTJ8_9MYCO|nr:helix-turn-helix domain-containing protein [Candidatus Mycobacterium methanotrophicum]UQX13401.1 helix-turn-helix domain-containing protein [Candidatus Mycobacterium methanotrophicum]